MTKLKLLLRFCFASASEPKASYPCLSENILQAARALDATKIPQIPSTLYPSLGAKPYYSITQVPLHLYGHYPNIKGHQSLTLRLLIPLHRRHINPFMLCCTYTLPGLTTSSGPVTPSNALAEKPSPKNPHRKTANKESEQWLETHGASAEVTGNALN